MDDFVQREGFFYEKFTDVPFSGKVTGSKQASFKNGEQEGPWVWYNKKGQSYKKDDFKNGVQQ